MIQQMIILILMLIVFLIVNYLSVYARVDHPGLQHWLAKLHELFIISSFLKDIIYGALFGLALAISLQLFDAMIAVIAKKNVRTWIHRTDHFLPETLKQKRWALAITVVGSSVEELLFRGFIFMAIMPIWSHWIWSALILSAIFALMHANIQGFWSTVWIFLISLILCMSVADGKSLYFIASLHILINITNLFILPKLFKKKDE